MSFFRVVILGLAVLTFASARINLAYANRDPEIVLFLLTVYQDDMRIAAEAKKKSIGQRVFYFSNTIEQDQSRNYTEAANLSNAIGVPATESEGVQYFRMQGKDALEEISELNGTEFELAFINVIIRTNSEAVGAIDKSLLTFVVDSNVKQQLIKARNYFNMHLDEARKLHALLQR